MPPGPSESEIGKALGGRLPWLGGWTHSAQVWRMCQTLEGRWLRAIIPSGYSLAQPQHEWATRPPASPWPPLVASASPPCGTRAARRPASGPDTLPPVPPRTTPCAAITTWRHRCGGRLARCWRAHRDGATDAPLGTEGRRIALRWFLGRSGPGPRQMASWP